MMRRIQVFILAALMPCGLYASFSNTMQWEVRTTGNDANGGGYDVFGSGCGTDYSQQNSPQQAYTDIVIGGTTTHGTSAARPFTSVDVCNVINVTGGAGCTVQRNLIVSVAANVATFTTALGTGGSTCIGNEGGALLTVSSVGAANPTAAIAQNVIWLQSGTYTITTGLSLTNNISVIGYKTTHGDNPTGTDRPLITTATNSITLLTLAYTGGVTNNTYNLLNLRLSNTAGTRAPGVITSSFVIQRVTLRNCQLDGFTVAVQADTTGSSGSAVEVAMYYTEVENSTTYGVGAQSNFTMSYCYIHDNAQGGVIVSGGNVMDVDHTVFSNNGGFGLKISSTPGAVTLTNDVFYGTTATGGTGCSTNSCAALSVASGPFGSISVVNNVFYGNAGWNISAPTLANNLPISQINRTNAFKAGTLGDINTFTPIAWAADSPIGVTLTVDPFTNAAGGDFSLNNTVGGGAALKGVGFPGVSGLFGAGYLDINVLQSQAPTGAVQINAIY